MHTRPSILERGEEARLFPVGSSRQKEAHVLSTLLAVFRLIPKYTERMLKEEARALTLAPSHLQAYTEVRFKPQRRGNSRASRTPQPDGYLTIESRGKRWSALVEAKVKNEELKPAQLESYLDLAREIHADAVITISNQFALDPTYHPVRVSGHKTRSVGLYHLSWLSLLSNAQILADSDELTDDEQAFVLRELIRFLSHSKSGVRPFDRMGPKWKDLCVAIQHGKPLAKNNELVTAAVADWQQLTRFVALQLSPKIGQSVSVYIKRSHRRSPQQRAEADANDLVKTYCFNDYFDIENAASRIELTVNLAKRHIVLSMELDPPGHKKRPRAAIRWLTRQLDTLSPDKAKCLHLRAEWPGHTPWTMKPLLECREDPGVLVPEHVSELPRKLKVQRINYLGGRFVGPRTLVEDVENAFKEYYETVGQNLRQWTPPPPKYRKQKREVERDRSKDDNHVVAELSRRNVDTPEPDREFPSPSTEPMTEITDEAEKVHAPDDVKRS